MRFEWDPEKARTNKLKHGVSFETATEVWKDPLRSLQFDQYVDGQERWQAVGMVGAVTLLLVVYVEPDEDVVRIITARKAIPKERRRYEQQ